MMAALKRLVATAALLGIAASPAWSADAGWDAILAAARAEGKVVVYNMALGAPYYAAVIKSFETRYGIAVENLDLRASELAERIRTEQAAGRYLGDAELITTTMIEEQLARGDAVQSVGSIPNAVNLREPFRPTDVSVPIYIQAMGILVNTRLVKPDDEPRSWQDLTAAKWRGKVLSDDMRPLGSGNAMFAVLENTMEAGFNEKLAEQKPVFSRDMRNDARRVARGEYAVYIPQVFAFASDLKGLPVKVIIPVEGAPYATFEFAVLKNAPHRNAARLLINHFLDAEAQLAYANAWMMPVTRGIADRVDADARPFASAKLLGTAKFSERPAMMARAKELYK